MSTSTIEQKKPLFGIISLCAPAAGVLLGLVVLFLSPLDTDAGHMWLRDAYRFVAVMFFSFAVGSFAGLIAWERGERNRKLTVAGLLLNGFPLLYMLLQILFSYYR